VVHGKAVSGTGAQVSVSPSAGATAAASSPASATGVAGTSGADPPEGPVTGEVVNVASTSGNSTVLGTLTAVEILIVVAVPPALYALLRRRRRVPR
jgi:hypothetical protein